MSKLQQDVLKGKIAEMLNKDNAKERKFLETVEVQIKLKGYNIDTDKRFVGQIQLPHEIRPGIKIGVLGNQVHCNEGQKLGLQTFNKEALEAFNRDKKVIKKWCKKFHLFLGSKEIVGTVSKLLGPTLAKAGRFPIDIADRTVAQVRDEQKRTANIRLKKEICIHNAVGNVKLTERQLAENITMYVNYFASLLKKGWQNIGTIHIHRTMGKSHRIY